MEIENIHLRDYRIAINFHSSLLLETLLDSNRDLIKEKLEHRFSNLKSFFKKNEFFYFLMYRFVGGGGVPYGIQNVLPVLFDISVKNYFLGTLIGSAPLMFVSVALGSGIELSLIHI